MQVRKVSVVNRLGLHARASVQIVRLAGRFRARILLRAKGQSASARSLVAVMMLAAATGTTVVVEADGPDEVAAVEAIVRLFDRGFGEQA